MNDPMLSTIQNLAFQFVDISPVAVAEELEKSTDDDVVAFLGRLSVFQAADVLEKMTPVGAQNILELLPPDQAGPILQEMDISRAASLISRLDSNIRRACLANMIKQKAKEINELASYPEDTAGLLMDPQVMAFHSQTSVQDVLSQLRRLPQKKAREIFLVDENSVLVGSVSLQELVVAESDQTVGSLSSHFPKTVLGVASRNEVVDALEHGEMTSVVVVDVDNHLLGVIRRDTLIKAVQEDASLDVQTMVGASKDERALSSSLFAVKKRLPWLIINLGTAFLAASVVGIFESTIAQFTALAILLPVVAGQSGNTGAQSLAVTMRGLALREVRISHALKVCFKEMRAAFINGIAVASVTATAVYLWNGSLGLTLVIGISMIISMVAAGLAGAGIPMLLTLVRQDPAQSSSIILTTVTDVVGFFSFLGIATALSSMI
ncbi:MAG: magnesium transporter [Desulfobacterales bacterium]|nr:magnesium transporter [Desulfobacterales bacterium]